MRWFLFQLIKILNEVFGFGEEVADHGLSPAEKTVKDKKKKREINKLNDEKKAQIRNDKFNSKADPVADLLGNASRSHPERLKDIIADLKNKSVEIIYRSDEALGYSPGLREGIPGQIIIHENASISAWEHEYIHFLNDEERGFLGMKSLYDSNYRVLTELNAYTKEVEFVKSLSKNNDKIIKQLKKNFFEEFKYIIENFGDITSTDLIDRIKNFKKL